MPKIVPERFSRWEHIGSGKIYAVLIVSNLNSTREDFVPTVVYSDWDDLVWSRPLDEFLLKFKQLEYKWGDAWK